MSAQSCETSGAWQRLGSGIHSVVWRTRKSPFRTSSQEGKATGMEPMDDLPNWVAIKVVYDNLSMPPHDVLREAAILRSISHTNIISIIEFVRGGPSAPFALYMPLIPLPLTVLLSSPLFVPYPITGPYSALTRPVLASSQNPAGANPFIVVSKSLIYQLLLSISYLHSLDPPISHRDINPGNVLIDCDGTVKLVDFGIAWIHPQDRKAVPYGVTSVQESACDALSSDWKETPDNMCCQVATGPHRAPELLFSPASYSAVAVDLWSLGTTIAQFFTPLILNPSQSPLSSPTSTASDDVDRMISNPFIVSAHLKKFVDYRATWERQTLFNGERGELGLAWSIFKLRGTPNKETWPTFHLLPDVSKFEFYEASPKPIHTVLPHLPVPLLFNEPPADVSPASLVDAFLAYPPLSRLTAAQGLHHPWFSNDLVLPSSHPGPDNAAHKGRVWVTEWEGKSLAEWLEPAMKHEACQITQTSV